MENSIKSQSPVYGRRGSVWLLMSAPLRLCFTMAYQSGILSPFNGLERIVGGAHYADIEGKSSRSIRPRAPCALEQAYATETRRRESARDGEHR